MALETSGISITAPEISTMAPEISTMAPEISTIAAALLYGFSLCQCFSDEIEKDELPKGRINNSMTEQINKELSVALKQKDITLIALTSPRYSGEIVAQGRVGSFATVTLSPELFSGENTKATEWRIARAIGSIQSDNLMPVLKKFGALALTAGVAHLLLGFCWKWAVALGVTVFNSYVTGPWVFDSICDAETLKFANSVATKEQLEGGISFLQEKAKASQKRHVERQEWLAGYHPYLKAGYAKAYDLFQQYVPGAQAELEETQKAYNQRFNGNSKPALELSSQLPKIAPKEVVSTTASAA